MSETPAANKVAVERDEYEFLKAIVEGVDEFLNAPFPRIRENALEWLKDMLGDDMEDDDARVRKARLDAETCEHCRNTLAQAFAWKARQRKIVPAPILTLHRHSDREH